MGWLKNLFRLRRQSDRVKWALVLFLLAGYFAVDAAMQLASFAALASKPVEYVLASGASGSRLETALQALRETDGVLGVSRQREYSVTVGEDAVTVTELSEQYLAECYGITAPGNAFWLSTTAFREVFGSGESPAHSQCQAGDRSMSGTFYRSNLPDDGPQAAAKGSSQTLGGTAAVRVMFKSADLSGTRQGLLESMGFSVQNQERLLVQDCETQLLLTRLRYGLCALALALLAGRLLYKEGKREVMDR